MKKDNQTAHSGGVGFFGLLGILFIALKLIGVINWSWWLVTLPLWGGIAVVVILVLIVYAAAALIK
ncbi:hypothetical protein UY416_09600 [Paenibacillus polymyxa]|uniref:hypothetical protein n=1 Tax=Paenibacillus polymyxa TaxID=1406 RepID=UPI002AB3902B|nr:hypothetical protein [Paenibacillus polymyxa]MDY8046547.1 hypothetical protein [Paenibacillus polymyxa]